MHVLCSMLHVYMLSVCTMAAYTGTAENCRLFEEAMRHGHIRGWLCKLLIYGAAGSGKTSSKDLIVGNESAKTRVSTSLAMRPTTVYRVNLEGKEWAKLTTLDERKSFLARALITHAPKLVDCLIATRSNDTKLLATNESQAMSDDPNIKLLPDLNQPVDDKSTLASTLTRITAPRADSSDNHEDDVDNILHSLSTDEELVKLMDQLSTTVDPLATFRILQIIDSGGQPQFHEVLPIFLRRLSFYLFVFRLCDELDSRPVVEFYVDGKPLGTPYTSVHTIEQLLQHCVRTMHSHRPSSGSEGECPQILVVGTHADREKESKENREVKNDRILKLLSPMLEKQVIYYNLSKDEVIFPLNAKEPGNDEQAIVEQIREVLLGNSSIQPADIPLKWFALEILLEQMVHSLQRGVLSKEECLTAAVEKLHFEEDSLDAAIQYLDELSVIFYYCDILPDVVFADPQVLLDKVTELVIKSFEIDKLSKEHALSGEWKKFHKFAVVTIEFLSQETFSKHYVPGLFDATDLVELFKKLLIFANISSSEFFVPALLGMLNEDEVDKHRVASKSVVPPLIIKFPDGDPRKGIYCSISCFLVSTDNVFPAPWTILIDKSKTPVCLYRNCIQFEVPKCPGTVTLIDTPSHFEVHIKLSSKAPDKLYSRVCQGVYQAIFKGLHKATLNLGYSSSSPSPALLCPCGVGEAHIATVDSDLQLWICSVDVMMCGGLTQQQQVWFTCHTYTATDDSRLTESHLPQLDLQLKYHASQWRDIGTYLGFRQSELDNVQARVLLLQGAPHSYLRAMLSEWLQWAPGDSRGSTLSSGCTLKTLRSALRKCDLGETASSLSLDNN